VYRDHGCISVPYDFPGAPFTRKVLTGYGFARVTKTVGILLGNSLCQFQQIPVRVRTKGPFVEKTGVSVILRPPQEERRISPTRVGSQWRASPRSRMCIRVNCSTAPEIKVTFMGLDMCLLQFPAGTFKAGFITEEELDAARIATCQKSEHCAWIDFSDIGYPEDSYWDCQCDRDLAHWHRFRELHDWFRVGLNSQERKDTSGGAGGGAVCLTHDQLRELLEICKTTLSRSITKDHSVNLTKENSNKYDESELIGELKYTVSQLENVLAIPDLGDVVYYPF